MLRTHRLNYIACCTLLALGSISTASATMAPLPQSEQTRTQADLVTLDIPAQALSESILALAEAAQVQIIFAPEIAEGITAPALSGEYNVNGALAEMLEQTNLIFERQSSNTYVVTSPASSGTGPGQSGLAAQLANAEGEGQGESVERIQVVGSNIRGARAAGALPVTILNAEDIANTGAATGDDLMRSIPQIGDISFNNERSIGGVNDARGDVASINMRGIGTGNTLTLLNGRRMVKHPGTQTENFVPVTTVNSNTLPVAGLRRVEILRDGASAIYGTDAVAGVVNYVLKDDLVGSNVTLNYGKSQGTELDQVALNASTGFYFNDSKSHLTLSAAYYDRNPMPASDRPYSASHDRRNAEGLDEAYVGDTQLDNRSLSSSWGIFDGENLGRFHIRPDSMGDCVVDLDGDVCAADGSLPRDMRYDAALEDQTMTSGVERINLFGQLTHEISPNLEFFSEALFYGARSERRREMNANLTAQRFTISADSAINPFGETVTLRNYRPMDVGRRHIEVEDTSYRVLGGLRGYNGSWDWESALLYSRADTLDTAFNRISVSALQEAMNQTDPALAYSPFLGGNPNNLNTGYGPSNPQSVIDGLTHDITRDSYSELALWDFKVSNAAIASWYAGDIGLAAGVEYRYESYGDDRHYLLDGSTPFYDQVTGELLSDSDVLGSSATPDASGSRNVLSAYTELLVPLHDTVDMQVAVRHERFNDVGNVTKPKVAISWVPKEWVQFRAAYTEGFRAPNLPQVVEQGVSRSNTRDDPVTGDRYSIAEVRGGNVTLEPENSESLSYGFALAPMDNLLFTVDWWNIEQDGVVGILNSQTHLLYDSLLRSQGSQNEAVIRDENLEVIYVENQYNNLDVREIEGVDISASYALNTDYGRFNFSVNAAHLSKFEQTPDPISEVVLEAQAAGNPAVPIDIAVVGAGDLVASNGNPEWRAYSDVNWRRNQWGAGLRVNYVSDFSETSVTTSEGVQMHIPTWTTVDGYVNYNFDDGFLDGSSLRLGVRNIGDKEPPIADESFGYFSNVHSNRGRYIYARWSVNF